MMQVPVIAIKCVISLIPFISYKCYLYLLTLLKFPLNNMNAHTCLSLLFSCWAVLSCSWLVTLSFENSCKKASFSSFDEPAFPSSALWISSISFSKVLHTSCDLLSSPMYRNIQIYIEKENKKSKILFFLSPPPPSNDNVSSRSRKLKSELNPLISCHDCKTTAEMDQVQGVNMLPIAILEV